MRLTKNLSRHEFACQCGCGLDACDFELLTLLQEACDHFATGPGVEKASITITSGNRCAVHNAYVGGAARSKHIFCIAADHKIKVVKEGQTEVVDSKLLAGYYDARYPNKLGIGIYPNGRVHVDVRDSAARWDKS